MRFSSANDCPTLPELLRFRAARHPQRAAAIFVDDDGNETRLTYAQLWQQSITVANALSPLAVANRSHGPLEAPRALLLFPPGLEFLPAFMGAQLAGWIPVPTSYPKPHRAMPRLNSVARDCSPGAILTSSQTLSTLDTRHLDPVAAALPMVAVDSPAMLSGNLNWETSDVVSPESIALLQYTSGSTNEPKGVIVSQRNVMANLAAIASSFGLESDHSAADHAPTAVSWLPYFHDMGLVGGVLAPLFLGYRSVFTSPQSFVLRPIRWLKLISDYQASVSGGPNFAYELCADRIAPSQMQSLDLSSLRVAYCGAEPIRARTLHTFTQRFSSVGFRKSSFYPCYGLAEATLLAAGGAGPGIPRVIELDRSALRESRVELLSGRSKRAALALVACGSATSGTSLKIVDPETAIELPERSIGEVWLQGDSITAGYWNRPEENARRFGTLKVSRKPGLMNRWFHRGHMSPSALSATPAESSATPEPNYLRTGDLGFLDDGLLYITGRIKDIVIIRGRNYAPQDIEQSVLDLGAPLQGRCVAISVEGPRAEGLAIIAEVARDASEASFHMLVRNIRRAVIDEHEIDPRLVLLVRPGSIPMTTSGKVQRSACRTDLIHGRLPSRYRWERSGGAESPPLPIPKLPAVVRASDQGEIEALIRDWLSQWLISRVGIEPVEIESDRRFDDYGLDSLTAVELSGELEDWSGVELTPANAWEHPTIASMAQWVASGLIDPELETESRSRRDPATEQRARSASIQ